MPEETPKSSAPKDVDLRRFLYERLVTFYDDVRLLHDDALEQCCTTEEFVDYLTVLLDGKCGHELSLKRKSQTMIGSADLCLKSTPVLSVEMAKTPSSFRLVGSEYQTLLTVSGEGDVVVHAPWESFTESADPIVRAFGYFGRAMEQRATGP